MSDLEMSNVIHDQDKEDLRQKIKRQAKAKQTEALADRWWKQFEPKM